MSTDAKDYICKLVFFVNSFSKISKNNQVPFKKKQKTPKNHILLQDMLSVKRLASKTWRAFLLAKKTQAPYFGGEKLSVFTYHERLFFFMVNAGKYTIHGSYGYRNRSLFSIFFNAGLLRDRNVGLHTCGGSFMMDKLQPGSSAELQLSSFEVLFWVFHKDMNNCYWFWISYFWWIYATSKCWNTNYSHVSNPWPNNNPSAIQKSWVSSKLFQTNPAC